MDKKIRLKYPWLQKRMFPILMRGLLYQKSGVVVAVLHHRPVAVGQDRTGAGRGHPLLLSPLLHKRHAHRPGYETFFSFIMREGERERELVDEYILLLLQ